MNRVQKKKELMVIFPVIMFCASFIISLTLNLAIADPKFTQYNHFENEEDVSIWLFNPIISDIYDSYYRDFSISITHKKNPERIYPLSDDNYTLEIKEIQVFFVYLSDEETFSHGSIYTDYTIFLINYSEPQVLYFGDNLMHNLQLPDKLSECGEFLDKSPITYNSYRCIVRLQLKHIYDADFYDETFYIIKYDGFVSTQMEIQNTAIFNALYIAIISTLTLFSIVALITSVRTKKKSREL
jgi:hypothetical protein